MRNRAVPACPPQDGADSRFRRMARPQMICGRAMYFSGRLQSRAAARMVPPVPACTRIALRKFPSASGGKR